MKDLSLVHQPVGDYFKIGDEEIVSAEDLDFYNKNGFLKGIPILTQEESALLKAEILEIIQQKQVLPIPPYYNATSLTNEGKPNFIQMSGVWRSSKIIHDLLWHSKLVTYLKALLGGEVLFVQEHIFHKPAFVGTSVAWHQDFSYWKNRFYPMAHITCWLALDDVNEDNGCLYYVPKSHNWNLLNNVQFTGDLKSIYNELSAKQIHQTETKIPVILNTGECTFHHPLLFHHSGENQTPFSRTGLTMIFCKKGVTSIMNESHKKENSFPYLPDGELVQGQFFPNITRYKI